MQVNSNHIDFADKQQLIVYGYVRSNCTKSCPNDIIKIIYDFYAIKLKQCIYENDYDTNGICYLLGTNFNKTKWTNPAQKGLIKLKSSGWNSGWNSINNMVGRTSTVTCTSRIKNAWISFDFGKNIKIKPKNYTLRHRYDCDGGYLRNWNLLGSNDGIKWTLIKQHGSWMSSDKSLNKKGQSHTWTIENCDTFYQMFKIQMTGKNRDGHWSFLVIVVIADHF